MNIVFHRYNSICEPAYIDAFTSLGIDVIEDDIEMTRKSIPADERISVIAELILKNRPMFVFSINFFPYISDICERLGCLYVCVTVDCPVAELLSTSVRNGHNRIFVFDRAQYDEIHDENPEGIFLLPLGVNPVISAASNGVSAPGNAAYKAPSEYKYDVSFIGSLYNEKNPYSSIAPGLSPMVRGRCDGLLAAQELLGGMELLDTIIKKENGADDIIAELEKHVPEALTSLGDMLCDIRTFWTVDTCLGAELTVRDRLLLLASVSESMADGAKLHLFTRSDTSALKSIAPGIMIHGGVNTLTEMPRVFAESRINLNTTMRTIRMGLPQRIWDVLGCGGFLMTDARADIPADLIPGVHLEVYESINEACDKIGYYLTHEDERLKVARAGYEAVMKSHTVMNRVVSMISLIMGEG